MNIEQIIDWYEKDIIPITTACWFALEIEYSFTVRFEPGYKIVEAFKI